MNPVRLVLNAKASLLTGQVATLAQRAAAEEVLGAHLPAWLAEVMIDLPLARTQFSLGDTDLRWLSLPGMVEESTQLLPGRLLLPMGYLAIAECLQGTGDPYFLDLRTMSDDPPLVRAAHDSIRNGAYDVRGIECITSSLSDFCTRAQPY